MAKDQQEIRRKLRILDHAAASGDVSKACRYFGIGRARFYRWRHALADLGETGPGRCQSNLAGVVRASSLSKMGLSPSLAR